MTLRSVTKDDFCGAAARRLALLSVMMHSAVAWGGRGTGMGWNAKGTGWKIAAIVLLSGVALMVAAQQVSSLIVSGQQGQAKVVQVQGANYVEVNGLARLTGGSISFSGNQLVLTLPGSGGDSQAAQAAAPSAPAGGLSNDFLNAGIEAMSQV